MVLDSCEISDKFSKSAIILLKNRPLFKCTTIVHRRI
jgi:hypothetical protein